MQLNSIVFKSQQRIPKRHTGEGGDISPPLEWSNVPGGCNGFALISEDPDAELRPGNDSPFVHWLIYNLSRAVTSLPEELPFKVILDTPVSASQGINSFGNIGYSGPLPPIGQGIHRYPFILHSLHP